MRPDRPLSIAEVARLLGWTHHRTDRALRRLNEETHGMLLKHMGGEGRRARYTVTLVALKKAVPEWFGDVHDNDARLDALEEKIKEVERRQNMSASAIGALRREVDKVRAA